MLANWGVLCSYTNGAPLELQGSTVTPLVPFRGGGGDQTLFAFIQPVGVGEATVTIAGVPAYWYCANSAYVNRHIVILLCNFSGLMIYETEPINLCSLLSTTVRNVALTQARHLQGQVFTGHRLDSQWKWRKTL